MKDNAHADTAEEFKRVAKAGTPCNGSVNSLVFNVIILVRGNSQHSVVVAIFENALRIYPNLITSRSKSVLHIRGINLSHAYVSFVFVKEPIIEA